MCNVARVAEPRDRRMNIMHAASKRCHDNCFEIESIVGIRIARTKAFHIHSACQSAKEEQHPLVPLSTLGLKMARIWNRPQISNRNQCHHRILQLNPPPPNWTYPRHRARQLALRRRSHQPLKQLEVHLQETSDPQRCHPAPLPIETGSELR